MTRPLKPLKWYRTLAAEKGRREAGVFLVEGERAIRQIVDTAPGEIIEILSSREPPVELAAMPVRQVTGQQFSRVSSAVTPQGTMAVVRLPNGVYSDTPPQSPGNRVLLLEDVQDPGNVGTLIRTAAAFDYAGVILSEKCADPFSPKSVQATAGSVLALWLRRTRRYLELAANLRDEGFTVAAADLRGNEEPFALRGCGPLVLALGNEAAGLSRAVLDIADHRIRVPIARYKAESLNVAASGTICMYVSSLERSSVGAP